MPLQDVFDEARRVLAAARDGGVALRGTGGVAIALRSPSAHRPPLQRAYGDVDFVGDSRETAAIERLFEELGYAAEREFNDLHGERRLFFFDAQHQREADVFLDGVNACHLLELRDRLTHGSGALPPADLLLSKLQVVETNHKDFQDALALLADHAVVEEDDPDAISLVRIRAVCCNDWGWWRTVTGVAERTLELGDRLIAEGQVAPEAASRLRAIVADLETAPKSRKWRLRAKVGERKRWHEEPEGLEHSHA